MANYFFKALSHTQVNNNADDITVTPFDSTTPVPFYLINLKIAYIASDYTADNCLIHVGFSENTDGSNPIFFTGAAKADFTANLFSINKVTSNFSMFVTSQFKSIVVKTNTTTGNLTVVRISGLAIPTNHQIISNIQTSFGSLSVSGTNTYNLTTLPTGLYKRKSIYYTIPTYGTGLIGSLGNFEDISTSISSGDIQNDSFNGEITNTGSAKINTSSASSTTLSYWVTLVSVT